MKLPSPPTPFAIDLSDLVGCRYEHGHDPMLTGRADCLTCAREVRRRAGLGFPMPRDYAPGSIDAAAFADWHIHWARLAAPLAWCVASMRLPEGGLHVGIVLPGGAKIIHCRAFAGIEISPLRAWLRFIHGYYELAAPHAIAMEARRAA